MSKSVYEFTIYIDVSGESFVEYKISTKERKLIEAAKENGISFCDCEELGSLYERVMDAAREKIQEDLELTEGDPNSLDIDIDDLDFQVDF